MLGESRMSLQFTQFMKKLSDSDRDTAYPYSLPYLCFFCGYSINIRHYFPLKVSVI